MLYRRIDGLDGRVECPVELVPFGQKSHADICRISLSREELGEGERGKMRKH